MKRFLACLTLLLGAVAATPSVADVLYNNLPVNGAMAMASRPESGSGASTVFEIEAADDFVLNTRGIVNSASFIGLVTPGRTAAPSVVQIVIEIYRVFPNDSNVGRTTGPPTFTTPQVPTRVNSPSDVEFAGRDSATAGLTFTTTTLASTFTAANSVAPGGIHPKPVQTTGGTGPLTGQEVQFNVTFTTPFDLPADHYFFVPQVLMSDGAQFYWLSASRPITGAGTTPFAPDLQAWTRDAFLDPDWLRVGTDIVGAGTFNASFSLTGTAIPEPSTIVLVLLALAAFGLRFNRRAAAATTI